MANSPFIAFARPLDSQAGACTLFNGDFNIVEMVTLGSIINRTTATPPGSPAEGDNYIVGSSPTGLWSGHANHVAGYYNGWIFIVPRAGAVIWNVAEQCDNYFDGTSWSKLMPHSRTTGISAAGTTQGTATALTAETNFVTSATGGSADGVLLPTGPAFGSAWITVINDTAATVKIYPPSGGQIDSLGSNNPYSLATLKTAMFFLRTATQSRSLLSA